MQKESQFRREIFERCRRRPGRIALPESQDPRVLQAAAELLERESVETLVLFCDREQAMRQSRSLGIDLSPWEARLQWRDPRQASLQNATAEHLRARAALRGKSLPEAELQTSSQSPLDQAAYLLASEQVDAVVAGCVETTAAVIRAALRGVGLAPGVKTVSGSFVMLREEPDPARFYMYADCGVVVDPDAEQLADIAAATVSTLAAVQPKLAPVLAFLSFATKGSAQHPRADKVLRALEIFRQRFPTIEADGELQFDAAVDAGIGARKAPGSSVPGRANCFIFPNLDAGNIAYKITQRLAGFEAYGPFLQGTAKPYMDLSRGASSADISMSACIAMLKAFDPDTATRDPQGKMTS